MIAAQIRARAAVAALVLLLASHGPAAQAPRLPIRSRTSPARYRFGVVGDTGTGEQPEYQVAALLAQYRRHRPFDFVIMLGDNMYGSQSSAADFEQKFEEPFKTLLDGGVKFYAALGNHDNQEEIRYKPFNMGGERYYSFSKGDIQFFVLDSNYMDPKQLGWLEQQLSGSGKKWKVAYFHHPLYSSGGFHGSETDLRALVEPLFIRYGVDVVFSGHEHFYERVKPQNGVAYFTMGGSAKLRPGDLRRTDLTAKGFDTDRSFMVVQVAGDLMSFQTISRTGQLVDSGTIERRGARPDAAATSPSRRPPALPLPSAPVR